MKLSAKILLFLTTLFAGCSSHDRNEASIGEMEYYLSALNYHPDSALIVLNSLGNEFTVSDTTRYAIARNLTLAANSLPAPLDSITQASVVGHKLPTARRSAAFYTYGLAQYYDGHPLEALISLQSALSIGERYEDILALGHPFLVGDTHMAIAHILQQLNDSAQASGHLISADEAYVKYGYLVEMPEHSSHFIMIPPADSITDIEHEALNLVLNNIHVIAPDPDAELNGFMIKWISRVIFIALTIIIIAGIFYIRYRKISHQKDLDRDARVLQSLSAMMERELNYSSNLCEETESLRNASVENYALYEAFCSAFQVAISAPNERKRALNTLLEKLRTLLATPETRTRIERHVNLSTGNILARFREEFPEISTDDYTIFMYYATGFTARSISVLLDIPINQIYNKKSYLRRRIRNSSNQSAAIFLAFLD
ncbi:MAG: hypothetical protein K2L14_03200 [Duncaniella sp.]|nr:hypothetical protein [Duncaniella sp.]